MEIVLTTAVMVPAAVGFLVLGITVCRNLYWLIADLVGWPFP